MKYFRHWLPALLWATIIFYFSAQSSAPQISRQSGVQFAIQKLGHAIEYAILAVLVFRPLRHAHQIPLRHALLFAIILSGTYAASDEWHQYFVPGRFAMLHDVAIDTVGATIAMIALYFYESRRRPQTDR
jgi:VanZ family protein